MCLGLMPLPQRLLGLSSVILRLVKSLQNPAFKRSTHWIPMFMDRIDSCQWTWRRWTKRPLFASNA